MAEMEMMPMQTMSPAGKAILPPETTGVSHVPHKKTHKSLWHYAGRSVQIVFGNMATSAKYILERLTRSSNPKLRAFRIATIIITFPILALPLLIMTCAKTIIDQDSFPRQARFSYGDQWDTNPPKELSDYRLDLSFGKGATLTGYEIPPAPDVKPERTVVYFHDKRSTATSIFQHEHNRIQCMIAEGYRVICATYSGYGGSSGMILSTGDVRRAGQVFIDYARTLVTDDAPELVLWGWSTGANVAAQLADDNSRAVTKVVLQSPHGWMRATGTSTLTAGAPESSRAPHAHPLQESCMKTTNLYWDITLISGETYSIFAWLALIKRQFCYITKRIQRIPSSTPKESTRFLHIRNHVGGTGRRKVKYGSILSGEQVSDPPVVIITVSMIFGKVCACINLCQIRWYLKLFTHLFPCQLEAMTNGGRPFMTMTHGGYPIVEIQHSSVNPNISFFRSFCAGLFVKCSGYGRLNSTSISHLLRDDTSQSFPHKSATPFPSSRE